MSIEIKTVNPFWAEVQELLAAKPQRDQRARVPLYREMSQTFDDIIQNWPLTGFGALDYQWILRSSELREKCCKIYAWAIADPASVAFVAQHLYPQGIEIGAGTGYWAWQLSQCDIDILAFDAAPPDKIPNHYFAPAYEGGEPKGLVKTWYPVALGGPEKLKEYPERTLLLCWPDYASDFAYQCLSAYQGHRFVFVGEGDGGCTGNDAFFELLGKDWEETAEHPVQQWNGLHDHIWVYERSKEC